jgi:hypothetical protein
MQPTTAFNIPSSADSTLIFLAKDQFIHPFRGSDVVEIALSLADKLPSASPHDDLRSDPSLKVINVRTPIQT